MFRKITVPLDFKPAFPDLGAPVRGSLSPESVTLRDRENARTGFVNCTAFKNPSANLTVMVICEAKKGKRTEVMCKKMCFLPVACEGKNH